MSEKEETEKPKLSKEDLEAINKDINDAKASLVSKDTQDVIEKAKKETEEKVRKEVESEKQLESIKNENEKLKQKLEEQEKASAERLDIIQSKVDEMATSKQPITTEDPFAKDPAINSKVDNWSNDKVEEIEEASARKFFGVDYDDRI